MNFFNLTTSCVNYYIINDLQYLVKGEDICACGYVCGVKNRDFRFLCLVSNSSSPKRKQLNILISKTLGKKNADYIQSQQQLENQEYITSFIEV